MIKIAKVEYAKNYDDERFMFLEFALIDDEIDSTIGAIWIGWDNELKKLLFFNDEVAKDKEIILIDKNDDKFSMSYNLTKFDKEKSTLPKLILDEFNDGKLDIDKLLIDYMI